VGIVGFRRSGGRGRPGTSGGRPGGHLGLIPTLGRGGGVAGELVRQSHAVATAGARASAKRRPMHAGLWLGHLR
jgi:hypothetical protein